MKSSAILVGSSAALAASQATFPEGFPQCGQVCITNMLNLANNFGCGADPVCLCTKADFIYGIRDCSNEYCQDSSVADQVINYGAQYCADAGIVVSGLPGNTASGSVAPTTTVEATATATGPASEVTTGSEAVTSGVAIATSPIVSVISGSDGVVTSTVGSTTIFSSMEPSVTGSSSSGTEGGAGGAVPISTETLLSTITSGDSVITSTVGTSTIYSTPSGSGTESGSGSQSNTLSTVLSSTVPVTSSDVTLTTTGSDGQATTTAVPTTVPVSESGDGSSTEAPSSTGEGGAAQHTAAPLGIIAAAGVAALLL